MPGTSEEGWWTEVGMTETAERPEGFPAGHRGNVGWLDYNDGRATLHTD